MVTLDELKFSREAADWTADYHLGAPSSNP